MDAIELEAAPLLAQRYPDSPCGDLIVMATELLQIFPSVEAGEAGIHVAEALSPTGRTSRQYTLQPVSGQRALQVDILTSCESQPSPFLSGSAIVTRGEEQAELKVIDGLQGMDPHSLMEKLGMIGERLLMARVANGIEAPHLMTRTIDVLEGIE